MTDPELDFERMVRSFSNLSLQAVMQEARRWEDITVNHHPVPEALVLRLLEVSPKPSQGEMPIRNECLQNIGSWHLPALVINGGQSDTSTHSAQVPPAGF